jgi:hypothetical protein
MTVSCSYVSCIVANTIVFIDEMLWAATLVHVSFGILSQHLFHLIDGLVATEFGQSYKSIDHLNAVHYIISYGLYVGEVGNLHYARFSS